MSTGTSYTLSINFVGADKGATSTARTVGREITGLGGKVKGLATGAALLTGGAFLLKWGKQAVSTYRTVGGELIKLQRLAGTTDDRAAGLYVWAQQSGVATTKLSTALGLLSTNIQNGKAAKLGLDLKDATGAALPLDQALAKISDRVAKMPAGAERNNLVRGLFGKSGLDLLPMLLKGGDAIDVFTEKAKQLGISINGDDIKQATQNQRDLNLAWTAAGVTVGKEVLPYVTQLVGFMARNLPPVVGILGGLVRTVSGLPMPLRFALGALVALGPAVKVLSIVATPFKLIAAGAKAGGDALTMFRLGLAGATEKGAGFSNWLGGAVSSIGGLSTAALLGGVAVVGLGAGMLAMADKAEQSRREAQALQTAIASVRSEMDATGKSAKEVFRDTTLPQFLSRLGPWLKQDFGLGAEELLKAVTGSGAEFDRAMQEAFGKNLSLKERLARNSIKELRAAYFGAINETKAQADAERDLGSETDATTGAVDRQTGALTRASAATDLANQRLQSRIDKVRQQADADRAAQQATADRRAAEQELAAAEATAAGTSDEARQAAEAVADARRSETEAADELARAQLSVAEARSKLNDAEAEAADRLRDLALAARESRTDEAGARVALDRARKELERAGSNKRNDPIARAEAAQRVREAEDALAAATLKRQETEKDNAKAQAAGVAGDDQVVAARKAVTDANRSVVDAEQRVQDAQRSTAQAAEAQAKLITDARAHVQDAAKKVEDAIRNEAQAAGDAEAAHNGAAAGILRQIQVLDQLAGRMDPNSPLRRNIEDLAAELAAAFGAGSGSGDFWSKYQGLFGGNASRVSGGGSARTGGASPGAANAEPPHVEFHQTNIIQGTPRQQTHALRQAGKDGVAKAVGG